MSVTSAHKNEMKDLVSSQEGEGLGNTGQVLKKPKSQSLGDVPTTMSRATEQASRKTKTKQAETAVSSRSEKLPELTQDQKDQFSMIFTTLAIEKKMFVGYLPGLASLALKKNDMEKAQKKLEKAGLHPLTTLAFFVTSLKQKFIQVHKVFKTEKAIEFLTEALGNNPWDLFIQETSENLQSQNEKNNLVKYLKDFAKKTGLDRERLKAFVTKQEWENLIYYCFAITKTN